MALRQVGHDLQGIDGDQVARRNGRTVNDVVKRLKGNGGYVVIGVSRIGLLDVLQGFLSDEGRHSLLPFGISFTADLVKGRGRNVFGLLLKLRRYDAVLAQKVGYALADDGRFDGAVLFPKRRAMQVAGSRRRPQIKA